MQKNTHVTTGIRKTLEHPFVYNTFQYLIGGNKHRSNHFKKFLNGLPGQKILDIGCGTAVLLDHLVDGVEYHGCDMQESYISFAKDKFGDKGNFYVEKVGEVIRKDWLSYFNIINAHGLLHHLSNEHSEALLKSAYGYLDKGGYLVTVDSVFHEDQSVMSKWLVSKDRGQNIRTPKEYIQLADKYFDKVETFLDTDSLNIPYSIFTMVLHKTR